MLGFLAPKVPLFVLCAPVPCAAAGAPAGVRPGVAAAFSRAAVMRGSCALGRVPGRPELEMRRLALDRSSQKCHTTGGRMLCALMSPRARELISCVQACVAGRECMATCAALAARSPAMMTPRECVAKRICRRDRSRCQLARHQLSSSHSSPCRAGRRSRLGRGLSGRRRLYGGHSRVAAASVCAGGRVLWHRVLMRSESRTGKSAAGPVLPHVEPPAARSMHGMGLVPVQGHYRRPGFAVARRYCACASGR